MSHSTRLTPATMALFDAMRPYLKDGRPMNFAALAERFGTAPSAITNRIAELRDAGLIRRIGHCQYEFGPIKPPYESHPAVTAPSAGTSSGFIAPISKARLMAGKA